MGIMTVMKPDEGDVQIKWNPTDEEEVANAKRTFADLRSKGYAFFKVPEQKAGQKAGEQIHDFDPDAGEILVRPALAGG